MDERKPPRIAVKPGVWKHGQGEETEVIRVYRVVRVNGHRERYFAGVIPYEQARSIADSIHDACDEHEARQRLVGDVAEVAI